MGINITLPVAALKVLTPAKPHTAKEERKGQRRKHVERSFHFGTASQVSHTAINTSQSPASMPHNYYWDEHSQSESADPSDLIAQVLIVLVIVGFPILLLATLAGRNG